MVLGEISHPEDILNKDQEEFPFVEEVETVDSHAPLAERMRPLTLDEYAGQQHLLGEGKLLRRAIESDRFSSIILYGPAGTGKTSLAEIIARTTQSRFERASGATSNVAELRKIILAAKEGLARGRRTVLFVDEIHRFSKSQQDVLLPDVEQGNLRLIGATTMNPSYYVNAPLVSRSLVCELKPLSNEELGSLIRRACLDQERGLGKWGCEVEEAAGEHFVLVSNGDARKCLNCLELAVTTTRPNESNNILITKEIAEEATQQRTVSYDKDGDGHYDTLSAFIKSIRGGDPDASLYWLAKMLEAGEDVRLIARRLIISSSEDIGLADSRGLLVATAAQQACETVGLPEAEIVLAHATVYLATAPKSNSSHLGLQTAKTDIRRGVPLTVPDHLKNGSAKRSPTSPSPGKHKMPGDFHGGIVPQSYLPGGRVFYFPTERGEEKRIGERLAHWKDVSTKSTPGGHHL